MKLPQHPALPWVSLALLGYLTGDLAAAIVERQFQGQPRRKAAANAAVPAALNGIKMPGELTHLLASRASQEEPAGTNTSQPSPGNATASVGVTVAPPTQMAGLPQWAGTLEGQGQSLAVLQMGNVTQVVGVGEEWMGFKVLEVSSFQARLRDPRGQEATISMQLANTPGEVPPPPAAVPFPGNATMAPTDPSQPLTQREIRAMLDNKEGWVKNILVQPVVRNGESMGVQINYSSSDNPFPRLGILTGDIITSLNGKPLHGMADFQNAYMDLRNSSTLNFQVERAGQNLPITVNLLP